jgi:hypothetical protein
MPGARIEAEAGRNAARRRLHDTRTVSGGADMRPLPFIVKQNRCFVIALKRHRDNNRSDVMSGKFFFMIGFAEPASPTPPCGHRRGSRKPRGSIVLQCSLA